MHERKAGMIGQEERIRIRKERRERRRKAGRAARAVLLVVILSMAAAAAATAIVIYPKYAKYRKSAYKVLSQVDDSTFMHNGNTEVYDSTGALMGKLGNEEYEYLPVADIPDVIKDGYIAVEDRDFAVHHGVDWKALMRAAFELVRHRGEKTQGGSTITMQVVKNNLLTQEKSYSRKILEIMLAGEIEKRFDKGKIMEIYCNTNYYGENCYGVEAASRYYFGKDASALTAGEAAMLIGMSNSPSRYDPVDNYDACLKKRDEVLSKMEEAGVISDIECGAAKSEQPVIAAQGSSASADGYGLNYAVHCTALEEMRRKGFRFEYVFQSQEAYDEYRAKYDEEYSQMTALVRGGGYKVYTSIDPGRQQVLQDAVSSTLSGFTEAKDDGTYAMQGAAVSIDNSTGLVTAIVGGREPEGQLNRAYLARRQPGSSIKPLLDYGPAMDLGVVSPGSIMDDHPVTYGGYSPKNSGGGYRGVVTVREALARSINTVAVQLFEEAGPERCLSYLGKLKFSTLTYSDMGNAAVSIGGFTDGVTLCDMARGYAAVENGGRMRSSDCLVKVTTSDDRTIYQADLSDRGAEVYSEGTAFMLTSMLQGTFREGYGTAAGADVDLSQHYAGKTGTTNDSKDAWFCGFTPYFTTVVWTGYDSPRRVRGMYGSKYPLTIFSAYMNAVHAGLAPADYPVTAEVKLSGDGGQMDVAQTGDVYGSRPEGYDYVCPSNVKDVATAAEKRKEKAAEDAAEAAVEAYEALTVDSADTAAQAEDGYYAAMETVGQVSDESVASPMRERLGKRHDALSPAISAWAEAVKDGEEQKRIERSEDALEKSQQNADDTASGVKQRRLDALESIIAAVNGAAVYTDALDGEVRNAEDELGLCEAYPEHDDLSAELDGARQHVKDLKGAADAAAEAARAAEEAALQQAQASGAAEPQ